MEWKTETQRQPGRSYLKVGMEIKIGWTSGGTVGVLNMSESGEMRR